MRVANARIEWAMALVDLGEEDEAADQARTALDPTWFRPDTEKRMRRLLAQMRDRYCGPSWRPSSRTVAAASPVVHRGRPPSAVGCCQMRCQAQALQVSLDDPLIWILGI